MQEQKGTKGPARKEIQLVIFRLGQEEFGLDISHVREIIRMQLITPMPHTPEFIEGVINLRGQIIAIVDLAKRFGFLMQARTEKSRIVVMECRDTVIGLIVDEVPEVLRLAEEAIDPTPEILESQVHAEFIQGVGKLNERLIIVLSAEKIISHEEAKKVSDAAMKKEA